MGVEFGVDSGRDEEHFVKRITDWYYFGVTVLDFVVVVIVEGVDDLSHCYHGLFDFGMNCGGFEANCVLFRDFFEDFRTNVVLLFEVEFELFE
jgi:hypothetical protein